MVMDLRRGEGGREGGREEGRIKNEQRRESAYSYNNI